MEYYWMNKEDGYIIPESRIMEDCIISGYDDIADPCSAEYMNYSLHYTKTNIISWQ